MSTISIDKDLSAGEEIGFRLEIKLFEEEVDTTFDMFIPNAPHLVSKLKGIKVNVESKDEYRTGDNKSYGFNKYKKFNQLISPNRYKLLIVLNADKVPGDLATEDEVLINCAEAGLTNVPAIVLPSNSSRKNYLYLSVSASALPSSNQDTNTTGNVTEVKKKVKKKKITVNVPKEFMKSLISEKPTTPPQNGNVEDIIIFAYKQFDGPNKSSIKYKLMVNDAEVNIKNPPNRSTVLEYREKSSYSKLFNLNDKDGSKIICYIAIARYIYDGNDWKGDWLQTNASNEVIWGKAE